jgi:hypothetical protein
MSERAEPTRQDLFYHVFSDLFELAPAFTDSLRQGLSPGTASALRAFWRQDRFTELERRLSLSAHDGWDSIGQCCWDLLCGRYGPEPYDSWSEVAGAAEELAAADPLAGSIAALYALAAWEGMAGGGLLRRNYLRGHDPGWYVFPLSLGRTLLAADALTNARLLVEVASQVIEACIDLNLMPAAQEALESYRTLEGEIRKRLVVSVSELAWELHKEGCRQDHPNFRAELAALLWTLGDVPHATLMGPGGPSGYRPARSVILNLVDQSSRLMLDDPFVQHIWRRMLDRPPVDIRRHSFIINRVTNTWRKNLIHVFDGEIRPPLSETYAKSAVAYFAGALDDGLRQELFGQFAGAGPHLERTFPSFWLRLAALVTLNDGRLTEQERAGRWKYMTRLANSALEMTRRIGARDERQLYGIESARVPSFDRRLDLPFYYLNSSTAEDFSEAVAALESFRCAGLWFWLRATPPARGGVRAEHVTREDNLLALFLGAHFLQTSKPMHYRYYTPPPADSREHARRGRAEEARLNPGGVLEELEDLEARFEELWAEIAREVPEYSARRQTPEIKTEDFEALLRSHRTV